MIPCATLSADLIDARAVHDYLAEAEVEAGGIKSVSFLYSHASSEAAGFDIVVVAPKNSLHLPSLHNLGDPYGAQFAWTSHAQFESSHTVSRGLHGVVSIGRRGSQRESAVQNEAPATLGKDGVEAGKFLVSSVPERKGIEGLGATLGFFLLLCGLIALRWGKGMGQTSRDHQQAALLD